MTSDVAERPAAPRPDRVPPTPAPPAAVPPGPGPGAVVRWAVRLAVVVMVTAFGLVCARHSIGPKVMAGDPLTMRSITGDTTAGIAGFRYYLADGWHLPLLHTRQLGTPGGTVIAYTDSIPILALVAKVLRPLGVTVEQWWGWWLTAGYVAQGLAGCFAVRSWTRRVSGPWTPGAWLLPLAATPLFVLFPPFLLRQFHPSLAFHAPLLVAVGLLARAADPGPAGGAVPGAPDGGRGSDGRPGPGAPPRWVLAAAVALPVVALLIHPYHLLACLVVLAAGFADLLRRGTVPGRWFAAWLGATVAAVGAVAVVCGYLSQPTVPAGGYGHYALIPYSMFVPQFSSLTPWPNELLVAGDDFEGFAWLGVGGVLLILVGAALAASRARRLAVRHQSLLLGLALLFAYAVTPRVHLNPTDPLDLPAFLTRLTGSDHRALLVTGAASLAAGLAWLALLWWWPPGRLAADAGAAPSGPDGDGAVAAGPARPGGPMAVVRARLPLTTAPVQAGLVAAGFGLVALAAPGILARFTGTFRGSGRMVWSILYVGLVGSVALLARRARWPVALAVVLVAAGLQIGDTARLRFFDTFLYQPDQRHVDQMSALADLMRLDGSVSLSPGYYCTSYPEGVTEFIDVIGAAALAGVPIDNSYTARQVTAPCPADADAAPPPVGPGRTTVVAVPKLAVTPPGPAGDCRLWQREMIVCSTRWADLGPEDATWFQAPGQG